MPALRDRGLIARIAAADRPRIAERALVIAAHPDDETLGLGAQLHRFEHLIILHLTDGAPRDLADAHRHGFADARSYAAARARELQAALAAGGVRARRISLGLADQGRHDLAQLARRLAAVMTAYPAAAVITHAYEGGHPDHDAAAFAARHAAAMLGPEIAPELIEFPGYQAGSGEVVWGEFLAWTDAPPTTIALSSNERCRKAAMIACFQSQRAVLSRFSCEAETLRPAPRYDFTQPPHAGPLGYELLGFGPPFAEWRKRAETGLAQLPARC